LPSCDLVAAGTRFIAGWSIVVWTAATDECPGSTGGGVVLCAANTTPPPTAAAGAAPAISFVSVAPATIALSIERSFRTGFAH
jgi:hypothetical protein